MIKVDLKYLGMIAENVGSSSESIELDCHTIGELESLLKAKYPILEFLTYRIASNNTLVTDDDCKVLSGTEIALLPPFAGG